MSDAPSPDEVRNVIALGKTGVGKSETLNTILGQKYFPTGRGASVTTQCDSKVVTIHGMKIRLIDTPGEKDTRGIDVPQKIDDYILEHTKGIHVFALVLSVANRPTDDDVEAINQVQKQLGPGLEKHLMIIVTHVDLLDDGETLEGFLQSYADKHPIVAECLKRGRVLGFDNSRHATDADKEKQLEQFATKTQTIIEENGESFYSHAQLKQQIAAREEEAARERDEKLRQEREKEELRKEKERLEQEISRLTAREGLGELHPIAGAAVVTAGILAVAATGFGVVGVAGALAGSLAAGTAEALITASGTFAGGATGLATFGASMLNRARALWNGPTQ